MSEQSDPKLGINSWLEEELYQTYLHDKKYVDESWKDVFEAATATDRFLPRQTALLRTARRLRLR